MTRFMDGGIICAQNLQGNHGSIQLVDYLAKVRDKPSPFPTLRLIQGRPLGSHSVYPVTRPGIAYLSLGNMEGTYCWHSPHPTPIR